MEVVGVVFIAPNHFLAVAPIPPTADGPRSWSGRSVLLVRTVCPCTSTTEIATVSSNDYINGYRAFNALSDKAVVDSPNVHPGRSARTLKMNYTEPVTFGFFLFYNDRTVHA
jgi:hypothetical protein